MSIFSRLSRWKGIIAAIVILAFVVPAFLMRSIETHVIFGALVVAGVVIYLLFGRGAGSLLSSEDGLYEELLRKCRGDRSLANRLVEYERKRNPDAEIAELLRDAIERLEYDRR